MLMLYQEKFQYYKDLFIATLGFPLRYCESFIEELVSKNFEETVNDDSSVIEDIYNFYRETMIKIIEQRLLSLSYENAKWYLDSIKLISTSKNTVIKNSTLISNIANLETDLKQFINKEIKQLSNTQMTTITELIEKHTPILIDYYKNEIDKLFSNLSDKVESNIGNVSTNKLLDDYISYLPTYDILIKTIDNNLNRPNIQLIEYKKLVKERVTGIINYIRNYQASNPILEDIFKQEASDSISLLEELIDI